MRVYSIIGRGGFRMGVLAAAVMMTAGTAWATPISYGNRSGTTVDFLNITEDSGTDPLPLYDGRPGGPTVTGDTLEFQPTANFSSGSPDGMSTGDTTDGLLRLVIQAHQGFKIDTITLGEFGDFSLLAVTGASSAATATGTLFGTDNVSGSQRQVTFTAVRSNGPLVFAPFELTGPGADSGAWIAVATLSYTRNVVTRVEIELNNTLQTVVTPGASAFIAKKGVGIGVTTSVVPEPGTLALAAGGAVMMMGARWRDRRRV